MWLQGRERIFPRAPLYHKAWIYLSEGGCEAGGGGGEEGQGQEGAPGETGGAGRWSTGRDLVVHHLPPQAEWRPLIGPDP